MLPWSRVNLIAAREAMRAHQELDIDVTKRVDPFAALEASGVLPMRQPLDHVAGLYIPGNGQDGSDPGALINVSHPLSKQRYTAAHELCHHRRDRAFIVDRDTEWLARADYSASDRERIAEVFAAWLLMPKKLVEATLDRLGLRSVQLDANSIYTLSLEFGTSYSATLHHLVGMRLVDRGRRDQLLRETPKIIKQRLGGIDALGDAWKDVWLLGPGNARREVEVATGDALVIEVPEIPSSGYVWEATGLPTGVFLLRHEFRPPDDTVLGGSGLHRFVLQVSESGTQQVRLAMRRPWQSQAPLREFTLRITAEPSPTPGLVLPGAVLAGAR
jgi:predicted secreted protein/Zn-dependent peptidase ImmA (M78 family)